MKHMKTTISGVIVKESDKALFVNLNGGHSSVWIAKSQMHDLEIRTYKESDGHTWRGFSATIPSWLEAKLPWKDGPVPWATRPA